MKNNAGMKITGLKFLILIPVGVFLFCVFFEIANDFYWQKKVDKFVEESLHAAMDVESIDTKEEYKNYIIEKFKRTKMELHQIDVSITGGKETNNEATNCIGGSDDPMSEPTNCGDSFVEPVEPEEPEEYIIYVNVKVKHYSLTGYLTGNDKYTSTNLQGTFDDYNEAHIEQYKQPETEDDRIYTDEELKELDERTTEYAY